MAPHPAATSQGRTRNASCLPSPTPARMGQTDPEGKRVNSPRPARRQGCPPSPGPRCQSGRLGIATPAPGVTCRCPGGPSTPWAWKSLLLSTQNPVWGVTRPRTGAPRTAARGSPQAACLAQVRAGVWESRGSMSAQAGDSWPETGSESGCVCGRDWRGKGQSKNEGNPGVQSHSQHRAVTSRTARWQVARSDGLEEGTGM